MEAGLLSVAALILAAKALEEVMVRRDSPPLLGWAVAGIVLGPAFMGIVEPSPELLFLTSIGVYLFFFQIGLEEVDIEGIASSLNVRYVVSSIVATSIIVVGAFVVCSALGMRPLEALAFAVLAALPTASVVAKTLSDLGLLKTGVGVATFSYALIGEVLGLLLMGALLELSLTDQISARTILVQLAEVALFFVLAGATSVFVVPRVLEAVRLYMVSRGAQVGIIFGILLLFVGLGESMGVHGVMGALILGLALSDALLSESSRQALETLKRIGDGVFVPLFFAAIGLRFDWGFLFHDPIALATMLFLLVPYRVASHYVVLKAAGIHYAREIALSMLARGSVDLAVLAALSKRGLVAGPAYSLVVALAILSLVGYPIVAKGVFKRVAKEEPTAPPIMPTIARYVLGLIKVRDVMEGAPAFTPDTLAEEALRSMREIGAECAVVIKDDGSLVGLVSVQDLERAEGPIAEYVKKPRLVVSPDDRLYVVLQEMTLLGQWMVPVVEDEKVVGVVTVHGVLKAILGKGER